MHSPGRAAAYFISSATVLALLLWALSEFFSIRGVISMLTSRFFLVLAALCTWLLCRIWGKMFRFGNSRIFAVACPLGILLLGLVLDRVYPMAKPNNPKPPATQGEVSLKDAEGPISCKVEAASFSQLFRFFQNPPVYFQRLDTSLRVSLTNGSDKPIYIRDHSVSALKG